MPTHPSLVIFGYGNPSRGDDALGSILLARAEALAREVEGLDFALVEDFQLQVEHALDLEGRDLALFIDAAESGPAPFAFRRLAPAEDASYSTHAITPQAVLHAFRKVRGIDSPPSYVLAVRGSAFELGEDLSEEARRHLESASAFLEELLKQPQASRWNTLTTAQ
jgi:hydrogenase maturation protease